MNILVALNAVETFPVKSVVVDIYLSPSFTSVPIATAVSISWFLNSTVAILAFSIDFQSINFTEPWDNACAKLYIALDASWVLAPDTAATLATPLIAFTASPSSTPAFVNLPMFCVISLNEYIVSSAYLLRSSRYPFISSIGLPVDAAIVFIAPIWSSYSSKPLLAFPRLENLSSVFFIKPSTELVMFLIVWSMTVPITGIFTMVFSIPVVKLSNDMFFMLEPICSIPVVTFENFKEALSSSRLLIVLRTPLSKPLLSNCIRTILSSYSTAMSGYLLPNISW